MCQNFIALIWLNSYVFILTKRMSIVCEYEDSSRSKQRLWRQKMIAVVDVFFTKIAGLRFEFIVFGTGAFSSRLYSLKVRSFWEFF